MRFGFPNLPEWEMEKLYSFSDPIWSSSIVTFHRAYSINSC